MFVYNTSGTTKTNNEAVSVKEELSRYNAICDVY